MVFSSFVQVLEQLSQNAVTRRVAVAGADDDHVIEAVLAAKKARIAEAVLIGDEAKIRETLCRHGADGEDFPIVFAKPGLPCGEAAVRLIKEGQADFIMKGALETRQILKPVVAQDSGLRTGRTMSHVAFLQLPHAKKLMVCTDGGMVLYPTLAEKKSIIINAVETLRTMGYDCPKVAVLCGVEVVNPQMAETLDAAALVGMNQSGEIPNCIVVGPISYDLAMSMEIAKIKRYNCAHCGDFDVLVAPSMMAGNILSKSWIITAGATMAGLIVGARVPIVLTSRGAGSEEKLLSMAMAASMCR